MLKMSKDDFAKKIAKLGKYFGKVCEAPEDYYEEFGELGDEYFDEIVREVKKVQKFARFPFIAEFYEAKERIEAKEKKIEEEIECERVRKASIDVEPEIKLTEEELHEARVFWNFFKEVAVWRWLGSTKGIEFIKNGYKKTERIKQLTQKEHLSDMKRFNGCNVSEWVRRGKPALNCVLTNFYLQNSVVALKANQIPNFFQMATEELKFLRKSQYPNEFPNSNLLFDFKL